MTVEPVSLRAVLGEGVRRVREQGSARQDDVAREAQRRGLTWTRSKVAALERGEKPISLEEFMLLPRILADATGSMVSVGMLVPDDALIRLTDQVAVPGELLRAVFAGQWVRPEREGGVLRELPPGGRIIPPDQLADTMAAMVRAADTPTVDIGEAEQKAAPRLGVTARRVAEVAYSLWGHGLGAERDRIVKERHPDASADRRRALRGQVTRQLTAQIAERIGGDRGERQEEA